MLPPRTMSTSYGVRRGTAASATKQSSAIQRIACPIVAPARHMRDIGLTTGVRPWAA